MSIYQPYTYLIGWSTHNKWYYGVRYSQNCNPQDLWKSYFTSSKHVKRFRREFGEPDVIQVRRIFNTKNDAILWEERVLQKLNVRNNENWLNRNDCCAPPIMKGEEHPLYNIGHTDETKQKISEKNKGKLKGRKKTEEHRRKISEARKRNWQNNDELKKRISAKMLGNDYGKSNKGKIPSIESRKLMRTAKLGKTQRRCSCLLCHQEISVSNVAQHYTIHKKKGEPKLPLILFFYYTY
jgi:hypothetical protein